MKLIVDVNLSPRWIAYLQDARIDATHWSSLGANDALDMEIIDYALKHQYVVLTHDLDFGNILASTQADRPSVVQIRAGRSGPEIIGEQVLAALKARVTDLEDGALVTVDTKRTRLRLLPIGKDSER